MKEHEIYTGTAKELVRDMGRKRPRKVHTAILTVPMTEGMKRRIEESARASGQNLSEWARSQFSLLTEGGE